MAGITIYYGVSGLGRAAYYNYDLPDLVPNIKMRKKYIPLISDSIAAAACELHRLRKAGCASCMLPAATCLIHKMTLHRILATCAIMILRDLNGLWPTMIHVF